MMKQGKLRVSDRDAADVFFARGDRILIDKARQANDEERQASVRELAHMRCPDCGAPLSDVAHHGVAVEQCPAGHGMWLTEAEMRMIANRERHSWLGRLLYSR